MDTLKMLSSYESSAPMKSSFRPNTTVVCFAYSFFLVSVCLLNSLLGPISAATVLGLGLLSPFVFPRMLLSNPNLKYVLMLPLLAGVSSLWSQHPSTTIYYTAQLLLTVFVGFSLASFGRPAVVLKGIFFAYLIYAVASLALGKSVMWENNEYVFVGLSGAKNAYGAMNATVVLLGGYAIHKGIGSGSRLFAFAGFVALLVGLTGLVYSRASGATVTSIIGLVTYFTIVGITKVKATSRVVLLITFLIFGGMMTLMLSAVWDELYGAVLAYFGKSPDLTGRVDLWYIADNIISRNFWLGSGQFSFWVQGDPLPEAIWSQMGINSRSGFNFHNSFREVLVHLGILGLLVYGFVIVFLLTKQLGMALFQPQKERTFFVVIILSMIMSMSFESSIPLIPMSLGTIFMVTALTMRPSGKQGTN
jgi:exopolysaccharide production protein ExoQ